MWWSLMPSCPYLLMVGPLSRRVYHYYCYVSLPTPVWAGIYNPSPTLPPLHI